MKNCMKSFTGVIAAAMLVLGMMSCEVDPETKYVDKTYVAAVSFSSEDAGDDGVKVTMACATEGAAIYYTTDGSEPSAESTQYIEAVTFSSDTTVKAFAVKEGLENSPVSVATVSIKTKTVNVEKNIYVCPKCLKTYDTAQDAADCCGVQTVEVEKIVNVYGKTETAASEVVHYKQNINGNSYVFALAEGKAVEAGADVTSIAKTYEGFNVIGFVEKDSVLNVYYDRKEITLTYKINADDENSYAVKKGLYGATAGSVTDPTKEDKNGYHFNYWTTDGATEVTPATVFPAENVTYIASWHQIVQYTITYTSEYGTAPAAKTIDCHTALTEDYLPSMENQTVSGVEYRLTKWNKADGTKCSTGIVLTADMSLTAVWRDKNAVPEGFVEITAGTFSMGSSAGYSDNQPVHSVTISKNFYICNHEVTQKEYETYCSYGGSSPNSSYGDGDNYPAYYVSWYDAMVYCNKLSEAEGLTPCYSIVVSEADETDTTKWGTVPTSNNSTWDAAKCDFTADGYRLPTEAEWEYAARGGDTTTAALIYSGTADSGLLGNYAWYSSNAGSTTHEVKGKTENAYGIYDMSGNVWEWCWDWYSSSQYTTDSSGVTDTTGATSGSLRVFRGGSWGNDADACAVSYRFGLNPYDRYDGLGFRVCRSSSN